MTNNWQLQSFQKIFLFGLRWPWGHIISHHEACFARMMKTSCSTLRETFSTQTDNERRTFSKHKSSSQQCRNCFSYSKFAFTFFQLMKLNQHILPTISSAVDRNVSGSWISSFNLSKHPGERVSGMKWLTAFHYKGLSDPCLQLCRFNMVVGFDLYQDYSHKDASRKGHWSTLWLLYNFHLQVLPCQHPVGTHWHHCFVCVFLVQCSVP